MGRNTTHADGGGPNRVSKRGFLAMKTTDPIGLAMAGHAYRAVGNDKKAAEYDNPLTDFVNLVIAEAKAKQNRRKTDNNKMVQTMPDGRQCQQSTSGEVLS